MTAFNIPIVTALIIITIGSLVGLSFSSKFNYSVRNWLHAFTQAITKPLILIVTSYLIYLAIFILRAPLQQVTAQAAVIIAIFAKVTNVILVLGLFWFVVRLINAITGELYKWAEQNNSRIAMILFPLIDNSLKAIGLLILVNILLPFLDIPDIYLPIVEKAATILLIAAITWIILQLINASEQYISHRYGLQINENLKSRKIYTQITMLKKIVVSVVITVALAIALMTFERVRELGATLLASAGIIAAIGAFAAQKTLSSTFAGLQIALTQPIKINDAVLVENEFGYVEEITLNYVVIKIWDWRRLIVPINYFIEKPFQNWTRRSSNLIGAVMLYVDYSLPIDDVRNKFYEILATSALWDKDVKNLQVTDAGEHTIQLRLLVSAADAGKVFDLRCEVREKIIAYIQNQYPGCLPRMRIDGDTLLKTE